MAKRTTISLDDDDEQRIASVADADSVQHAVLVEIAEALHIPLPRGDSEAAVIRALIQVGAHTVHERALERGYAQLAQMWDEVHDHDEARERRRRYAERVDRVVP